MTYQDPTETLLTECDRQPIQFSDANSIQEHYPGQPISSEAAMAQSCRRTAKRGRKAKLDTARRLSTPWQ